MDSGSVGTLIRTKRIEKGLTQRQVADFVNVTEATVSRWESGLIGNMRRDKIYKLSTVLGISPLDIMGIPKVDMSSAMGKAVAKEHEKAGYYHDPKVAAMVDELKNRPGMRILFDASRDLSEDDINFVVQFVERLKKK